MSSRLTSGFGRRRIVNGETRSPHSGVDLKAKRGTPIKATNSGKVVLAENLFFAGKTIVLDHGLGLYTVYAHCSKMMVKVGQTVVLGEIPNQRIIISLILACVILYINIQPNI